MFGAVALVIAASLPVVDTIRIESRWGGLGEPSATTYTIVRRASHYKRASATVPQEAVDRFAAAVTAAPVERAKAFRDIATREWLLARAAGPHEDAYVPTCSADAKRLLAQRLVDPSDALQVLDRYFSVVWTDDYPFVSVDVTFEDRPSIHLESRAQHALMLPWTVDDSETWNPEIARAIVGLLPPDAEPRLGDRMLATAYVNRVAAEMRDSLDDLEARCIHRDFLAAVTKHFEIVRAYQGSPGDFTAYVRRADFPANLVLTLVIRDDDEPDAAAKLDRTVQRTGAYVALVRDYVQKHSDKAFAIWCADGISVEDNDRAVRISEYDHKSGIVSHPRIILPDGSIKEEEP